MSSQGQVFQVIHSDRGFIAQFWKYLWKKLQTKVALKAFLELDNLSTDHSKATEEFESLRLAFSV